MVHQAAYLSLRRALFTIAMAVGLALSFGAADAQKVKPVHIQEASDALNSALHKKPTVPVTAPTVRPLLDLTPHEQKRARIAAWPLIVGHESNHSPLLHIEDAKTTNLNPGHNAVTGAGTAAGATYIGADYFADGETKCRKKGGVYLSKLKKCAFLER